MSQPIPIRPIDSAAAATAARTQLRTEDGHSATLEHGAIVMRDPRGAEVVRYEPASGLRIGAPDGDLTLAAPRGRVLIEAGSDLELAAAGQATLRSASTRVETGDVAVVATRIETRARELAQLVGRFELRAQRLVESVTDAYREADGLSQLRAGRVRQLVRGACQLFAERTNISSEGDTSVDGDRVLLG